MPKDKDYLSEYLTLAPVALALVRAIECRVLSQVPFERPILDLGCGDGVFAQVFFDQEPVEVGLDRSLAELKLAARTGRYRQLVAASADAIPCPNGAFATIFSNGVLEHVDDLAGSLAEVARVLRPGGRLILTVPTRHSNDLLAGSRLLRRAGLNRLAAAYARWHNTLFAHRNLFDLPEWERQLRAVGLDMIMYKWYNSPVTVAVHDALLLLSLPSALWKHWLGRWVLLPRLRRFVWVPLLARLYRRFYDEETTTGGSLLIVATQ